MQITIVVVALMTLAVSMSSAAPGFLLTALPAPSSNTQVVRDGLGNQATSYAYQDGHSSAVALSRSDVSKVVYQTPVVAYNAPTVYHHAAPAFYHQYHHGVAPAYYF